MAPDVLGLMSVEQVASSLGVHVRTVRRYIHEGRLRATRIGRLYRIPLIDPVADYAALMESLFDFPAIREARP